MWEKVKQNAFGVVVYSVAAFFAAWGAIQASEAVASTPGGAQNNVIAAGLAWALPMVAIMAVILALACAFGRTPGDILLAIEDDSADSTATPVSFTEVEAQRDEFFNELFPHTQNQK